jgi:nitrogen fixation NifU-like protein
LPGQGRLFQRKNNCYRCHLVINIFAPLRLCVRFYLMTDDLQKRIQAALANPQNMGEMAGADSIGTVGNADCGEMLRLWVKFKEQNGKKVIDRATFQSFGCETAIAVASLATELIRGKTAEEALALKTEELAGELGPLPPMKIHCAQLVEGALRSALEPAAETKKEVSPVTSNSPTLLDSFSRPKKDGVKLTFLDEEKR